MDWKRLVTPLKAAVVIAGGLVFVALMGAVHFPVKSCAELKRMYEPLIPVSCGPPEKSRAIP